jgi:hypothetical protein
MLQPDEKTKLERGFAQGEASNRLEGLETGDLYATLKARVLAEEITIEQMGDELDAHYQKMARSEGGNAPSEPIAMPADAKPVISFEQWIQNGLDYFNKDN